MDAYERGFCVRKASWHGKETLLDDWPTSWDEARKFAGLTWEPTYRDMFTQQVFTQGAVIPDGAVILETRADDGSKLAMVPVDGYRAIVRDDTYDVLATGADSYELIYHRQMGDLLEAYTESWRKAGALPKYESVGSVRGGRAVFALLFLDEPYTVHGDESAMYPYAAITNAHDGSAACRLMPTQVRIVCWNTFRMADMAAERQNIGVVLRHQGRVSERIDEAKVALRSIRDDAQAFRDLAGELVKVPVSDAQLQEFIDEFLPMPDNAAPITRERRAERQAEFRILYDVSPSLDGVRGTGFGLFQAATEYLDHLRPYRSQDTYLARTILHREPLKGASLRLVRKVCG